SAPALRFVAALPSSSRSTISGRSVSARASDVRQICRFFCSAIECDAMIENVARRIGIQLGQGDRDRVADEQMRAVWAHATFAAITATAFAILMALHFRGEVKPQWVDVWIALKVLVVVPRLVQGQVFKRMGYPGGEAWRLGTYGLLAVDGLVFGVAGLVMVGLDRASAALAIASLGGIACVATFGYQADRTATTCYVAPILAGLVVGCFARMDAFGAYCGIGLSLFLLQILVSASRLSARAIEGFLLRIHAARISTERADALAMAERQSAAKTQFLGTVSHEFRTPIHGMLGVARLVHVETADPQVRKRMELIESSGTHLLGLVTDLIDVSRI